MGDGGLHSCFHWTWFSALSKQHFPPCAPTPPLLVPTIYSHGLTLKPPNTSPRQLLTLRQFCQRHLSRGKSGHTNCLLQTLLELFWDPAQVPHELHKDLQALLPGTPPLSKPYFFLCALPTVHHQHIYKQAVLSVFPKTLQDTCWTHQCRWLRWVKILPAMWETWVQSLGWENPLEKGMANHSGILAWRIPWTEEPGRLQSMGLQRLGHK